MAISKRLRYEVLRRDGFKCRYCRNGQTLLTVDHFTPVSLGGTDHPSNLLACCDDCNTGKSSALPGGQTVEDVNEDLLRWARALKRGDWEARETEAVINAAAHVWQSYWMPEHQADPTPEQIADFRRKALEVFPEIFSASDLMLAAEASGEQDIDDLDEALEYAKDCSREVWHHSDTTTEWLSQWREAVGESGPDPADDLVATVRRQAIAAHGAGYDADAINHAGFKAGAARDSNLVNYLTTATDALRAMDALDARRDAVSQEATRLWLDALTRIWGETWTPGAADVTRFTEHVAEFVVWHDGGDIFEAAQLAGSANDSNITKYLPRRSTWGGK